MALLINDLDCVVGIKRMSAYARLLSIGVRGRSTNTLSPSRCFRSERSAFPSRAASGSRASSRPARAKRPSRAASSASSLHVRVVARQPRLVQAVDGGDPAEPCLAPAGEVDLRGGALDEVPAHVRPNMWNATYLQQNCRVTMPPSSLASFL